MRVACPVLVSSVLLLMLGAGGAHPASGLSSEPLVVPHGLASSLLIVEFYPCAVDGDEYVVLSNTGSEAVNLQGWALTDGEGTVLFLEGVVGAGCEFSLSEDARSFAAAYGSAPDMCLEGWTSGPGAAVTGRFRLADAGDTIELSSPSGVPVDVVAYGAAEVPISGWNGPPLGKLRSGEVARRLAQDGQVSDSDSAADWMPFREHRYGYTDHPVVRADVPAGNVTAFTSPDCSLDIVLEVLAGASSSLRVCSYELSSPAVCAALSEARSRGVDVTVLVDASPAGGMSGDQVACLSALSSSGVSARVVGGALDRGIVRHVGALHAKYVVADGSLLVAMSENLVGSGVPVDRLFGNRGWGVVVRDEGLASFMARVFDDDGRLDRPDVWDWSEDPRCSRTAAMPEVASSEHPDGVLTPLVTRSAASVSVHISPDVSLSGPYLCPLVSGSSSSCFEQFQADLLWLTRWSDVPVLSPLVESLGTAMASGGSVRGLFDSSWFNVARNSEVVDRLSAMALAHDADAGFGLLAEGAPTPLLHNKGLVLDDLAVVSSNNWVHASFARNRELAVVVDSSEVSSHFRQAFALDWVPDTVPPLACAGPDVFIDVPGTVVLDGSCSRDDRAVAGMSWDLDGDGRADAFGPVVEYTPPSVGGHTVFLEVTDSWGNKARDSVVVWVGAVPAQAPPTGGPSGAVPWVAPLALSVLAAAFAVARKINL